MLNALRIAELKDEVGEEDFLEIFGLFCEEVEEVLNELANTSPAEMPGKLHFLKGSALNIGLDQVGQFCADEEARLKADPSAKPDIASIQSAYTAAKATLLG